MPMRERFEITVQGDRLAFAAAHFLAYGGGQCEAVHGHNYRVAVTVAGALDQYGLLVDFLVLRDAVEDLLAPLDHRTLLAGQSPHLSVEHDGDVVRVKNADRHMVFPVSDVVVLPISNTSAEMLAAHLARELVDRLRETAVGTPERLVVEVEESAGLVGRCVLEV